MEPLTGRVAIVTGGTKGLGLAIAATLADAGATVVAASRSPRREIELPHGVTWEPVDVTDSGSMKSLLDNVVASHGRLDLMVANAGISVSATIEKTTDEHWDAVLSTNLTGTFTTIRGAIPHIKRSGGGRIVTISSCMAHNGPIGAAAYAASKAGIESLTQVAGTELGRHGITVNGIAAGILDVGLGAALVNQPIWNTYRPHLALRRPGTAREVAALVLFLAGPDGAYINGSILPVDGGLMPWAKGE